MNTYLAKFPWPWLRVWMVRRKRYTAPFLVIKLTTDLFLMLLLIKRKHHTIGNEIEYKLLQLFGRKGHCTITQHNTRKIAIR